jgi:hypothetical protein
MKKTLLVLLSVLITTSVFAQDIIVTQDGRKINSKVTEINENDIRYKNFENLDGPTYTIKKSETATIIYENGQVDVFNLSTTTAPQAARASAVHYTQADFERAKTLRNAGVGCFVGGVAVGTIGFIVAVAGGFTWNLGAIIAGSLMLYASIPATIVGIVVWPIGQTRMNKINRLNPNGFSLFENEKVQLNLAANGLKLNF